MLSINFKQDNNFILDNAPINNVISENIQNSNPKKIQQDKKLSDLKILGDLNSKLEKFIKEKNYNINKVEEILNEIGKSCVNLSWDEKNSENIRNKYGYMNYAKKSNNKFHIHWEQLAKLQHIYANKELKEKFLKKINLLENSPIADELNFLQSNVAIIISNEKIENEKSKLGTIDTGQKKLGDLIDLHADLLYLNIIKNLCDPTLYVPLHKKLIKNTDDLFSRYSLARMLTRLGEASKSLSQILKKNSAQIPFNTIKKIRDIIGHKLTLTLNSEKEFSDHMLKICSPETGIASFYSKIKILCDELEKMINDTETFNSSLEDKYKKLTNENNKNIKKNLENPKKKQKKLNNLKQQITIPDSKVNSKKEKITKK